MTTAPHKCGAHYPAFNPHLPRLSGALRRRSFSCPWRALLRRVFLSAHLGPPHLTLHPRLLDFAHPTVAHLHPRHLDRLAHRALCCTLQHAARSVSPHGYDQSMKHYDEDHLRAWEALCHTLIQTQTALANTQKVIQEQISAIKRRQSSRARGRKYRKRHNIK